MNDFLKLSLFLLKLTTYVCCYATSFNLYANLDNLSEKLTKNEQLITKIKTQLKISQKEFNLFISKNKFCLKTLPKCLQANDIITNRKYYFPKNKLRQTNLVEFPQIIDLKKLIKLGNILNFSNEKQKQLVLESTIALNDLSSRWLKQKYKNLFKTNKIVLRKIAINNSAFILNENKTHNLEGVQQFIKPSDPYVVGILDSGISIYHEQMKDVNVIQYNPLNQSYKLKDTALGHASGILSLLAVKENKEIKSGYLQNGKYLSCNGLPKGKYNSHLILQCMNWFFLQPRVDVIINAWLASEAGCKNEWQHPIETLLATNIIPIFSAGNYANNKKGMNFSPANLILDNVEYPLVTAGALTKNLKKLQSSSFGLSNCNNGHDFKHYQANLFSEGEKLKVAVPFGKQTYQLASGTSYSIAKTASIIALLKNNFPQKSNQQIVNAILNSAEKTSTETFIGYGKIDYRKATLYLIDN